MNPARVIVNPRSAHQRTARDLPRLRSIIQSIHPEATFAETNGPGHATELTRDALRDGVQRIVVIGGDGTINEVVNGFFDQESLEPLSPTAGLGVITRGTGGDFRRTFNWSRDTHKCASIALTGEVQPTDVGHVAVTGHDGSRIDRFFINVVSVGLGGIVAGRVNESKWIKRAGGRIAFLKVTASSLLTHRPHEVTMSLDARPAERLTMRNIAICNGRFHGGGMQIAPDATTDDGLFDVVTIGGLSRVRMLALSHQIYAGTHLTASDVHHARARSVRVESDEPIPVEIDGETPGTTPMTITMRQGAIRLAGSCPNS